MGTREILAYNIAKKIYQNNSNFNIEWLIRTTIEENIGPVSKNFWNEFIDLIIESYKKIDTLSVSIESESSSTIYSILNESESSSSI